MKRSVRCILIVLCVLAVPAMLLSLGAGVVTAAEEVTITGIVNADGDFMGDDGQTYFIGANEKGDALADLADKKFKVTGTVTGDEGDKTIMFTEFMEIE